MWRGFDLVFSIVLANCASPDRATKTLSSSVPVPAHWARCAVNCHGRQRAWPAANIRVNSSTEAVLHVARDHADEKCQPEAAWVFLTHDFLPDCSLCGGRLGAEFCRLGDSKLVGYSNLSVRPSPDFRGSLVLSDVDGVDAWACPVSEDIFVIEAVELVPYWSSGRCRVCAMTCRSPGAGDAANGAMVHMTLTACWRVGPGSLMGIRDYTILHK